MTQSDIDLEVDKSRKARNELIERVKQVEQYAIHDPKGYRRKVDGLIALAYGYIGLILFGTLALLIYLTWLCLEFRRGNYVYLRLILFLGVFAFALIRSLCVRVKPPKGVVLKRGDAVTLYQEVDAIADDLKSLRPHEIRITYRMNASAYQAPAFGLFGPYRNTLVLGLPLMFALSPDEMRAVVAHEFGHFSRSHGKFHMRVYRIEQTWRQLWNQLGKKSSWIAFVFIPFVRWFQPRFSATTFVLRRAHEYEADQAAVEIAGANNIASGLLRMRYLWPYLEKAFWQPVRDRAKAEPLPPPDALQALPEVARAPINKQMAREHIARGLADTTTYSDTHPCLSDRLRSIGRLPENAEQAIEWIDKPIPLTAAEAFLGPRLPSLIGQVEAEFAEEAKEQWIKNHKSHQQQVEALQRLRGKAAEGPLTEGESVDLAYAVYQVEGSEPGEEEFRKLREAFPENPLVAFWLGSILADKEDIEAEPLLKEAMEKYPRSAVNAMNRLGKLYRALGEREKLEQLRHQAPDVRRSRELIDATAKRITLHDDFVPHRVTADKANDLAKQLATVPGLKSAYLMMKALPNGEQRMVLVAFPSVSFFSKGNEAKLLTQQLTKFLFPERTLIYCPVKEIKHWQRRVDSIPGAKLPIEKPRLK